jgi:hypothetical protein
MPNKKAIQEDNKDQVKVKRKYTKKKEEILSGNDNDDETVNEKKDNINKKSLNLSKARTAKQTYISNHQIEKEKKIDNLIKSLTEDELIKINAKNEKLKNRLMKMI